MESDSHDQLEQVFRRAGVRDAEHCALSWAGYGFGPQETAGWLAAGVAVDEPHVAAALAAAEWTPDRAGRRVEAGERITFVEAVRRAPNSATYARELRFLAG